MLSVVFPAFNEAESLRRYPEEVLPVLEQLGRPYEVVIVDDGSSDETSAVARSLGPRVRVVRHEQNRGLGSALRSGFRAATGELLVTMDADLTFHPLLIRSLLERLGRGDCDLVIGSPKLAGYGADIPSYRIAVSHAATWIYSGLLGQKITAVSPILRLYRREDLLDLPLEATGFDINAELLFLLLERGKRAAEIPAPLTARLHGESKLHYRSELKRHLRLVGRMAAWRVREALRR